MIKWRVNLILISIFVFGATIIGRLVFLQIIDREEARAFAKGQQKFFEEVQAPRGEIIIKDKAGNNYTLAADKIFQFVYASPPEVKDKNDVAEKLSQILNIGKEQILEKLENDESLFAVLKTKLTDSELQNIKDLNIEGIYLKDEAMRYYPLETLASHVVGFIGAEGIGQYGIEGFYNDILFGESGFMEGEKSRSGYSIFFNIADFFQPKKGTDLELTIDYNIQFQAENLLKKNREKLEFEQATIIVADSVSGKILALANYPNFNPNEYSKIKNLDIFQNAALQKLYEPGSVFKPITMSTALDKEKITPQTTYIDEGKLKFGGYTISNYDGKEWGKRTMTEVLERSINTGAVFAEEAVGNNNFIEYVKRFGFFEKTGIDLQGESWSENKNLQTGRDINCATAAFGQGVEVTPMQLIRAFSAIANGGKLINPYIVDGFKQNTEEKQIISSRTASQVQGMMVSVLENGYSKNIRIPGYWVAGKSGTAQVPWTSLGINKAGYSEKTIHSFIGFGPAYNAKFLILIKLDNPNTYSSEFSAAPIFKELARYIIDYWQIPPDYDVNNPPQTSNSQ